MVEREGLLEALGGLLARGEQRPGVVGEHVDVLVALARLHRERPHLGHQHQVGDVLVDRRAAAVRPRLPRELPHALGIATHERDLDAVARELDRGGAADTARGSGEQDECHRVGLYRACHSLRGLHSLRCPRLRYRQADRPRTWQPRSNTLRAVTAVFRRLSRYRHLLHPALGGAVDARIRRPREEKVRRLGELCRVPVVHRRRIKPYAGVFDALRTVIHKHHACGQRCIHT